MSLLFKMLESPEGFTGDLLKRITRRGTPISLSVIKKESINPLELHPLINKCQLIQWTFLSTEEDLRHMLDSVSELTEEQSSDLRLPEFMPQVTYRQFLGFKRQEARTRASLVKRLHASLTDQVSQSSK